MKSSVIRIGNSLGIIIPSDFLKRMRLAERDNVNLDLSGDVLSIRPARDSTTMADVNFYVCPVCGNVLYGTGKVQLNCHGHNLEPLEARNPEGIMDYSIETVEDEYYVTVNHEMSKQDYMSFMACASADRVQIVKLFPEGMATARFKRELARYIYFYSEKDGLFKIQV